MPYVEIPAHRIAYNVDGTKVGYNSTNDLLTGVTAWCTQAELDNLNKENSTLVSAVSTNFSSVTVNKSYYFFFTEPKLIKGFLFRLYTLGGNPSYGVTSFNYTIQGSPDSSDGVNGTWETATLPDGNPYVNSSADSLFWRTTWKRMTFTNPIKVLRVNFRCVSGADNSNSRAVVYGALAIYGNPAPTSGDYLTILNSDDTVKDRLLDFGDLLEGANATQTFKLKNNGMKTANTISLSLSGQDATEFTLSTDNSTFATTGSIASLAPGASATVYVKDTKPAGNIGPKQAIFKASVGSWT